MIPSTAIVLAGGFGTRLRSVVSDVPKPMAPIGDKPFLAYVLQYLQHQGIRDVVLAVGYKGELVEAHFGSTFDQLNLHFSYEDKPLGTGGAIVQALKHLNSTDPVWIFNGDTFFACDLSAVAKTHFEKNSDVTLALAYMDPADRYGCIELNGDNLITAFKEKQPDAAGWINAGVYLLDPEAIQRFDFPLKFSLEREFFEEKLLDLRMIGDKQEAYFVDIGIPEDYAKAQAYFTKSQS